MTPLPDLYAFHIHIGPVETNTLGIMSGPLNAQTTIQFERRVPPGVYGAWIAIVLLAGLLRFAGLDRWPPGLFRDEAEKGYNAYALATEGGAIEYSIGPDGRAEIGWRRFPLVIDVMGVETSAAYQYASVPFVKIFGLNVASTRMAAAMAGTLTVAAMGLLLLGVGPPGPALTATLWLALCPWHYVFSRWAAQGIFVPLWITLVLIGLALFEKAKAPTRGPVDAAPEDAGLAGAALAGAGLVGLGLGLIFYSYSGAAPFALAWGLALAVVYRRRLMARPTAAWAALALFLAIAGPRAWAIAAEGGSARLGAVAVWSAEDATWANTPWRILGNYLAHFHPGFLFVWGDELSRHSVPGLGQMLLIDALLLPVGIIAAIRARIPLRGALISCFLIGPAGAAITRIGVPHGLRAIPMALPAALFAGFGLWTLIAGVYRYLEGKSADSARARQSLRGYPAWVSGLILLTCVAYASRAYQIYAKTMQEDPEVQVRFAASERGAFEEMSAGREPHQRVWISGAIPYAPYYALFFGALPGEATARGGLESQNFTIFAPSSEIDRRVRTMMTVGDWLIDYEPRTRRASVFQKPPE